MDESKQIGTRQSLGPEFLGAELERVHYIPVSGIGYKSVTLCFSNDKTIHLEVELDMSKQGVRPVIRMTKGQWEMIKAAPIIPVIDEQDISPLPPPPDNEYLKEGDTKSRVHLISAEESLKDLMQDLASHLGRMFNEKMDGLIREYKFSNRV